MDVKLEEESLIEATDSPKDTLSIPYSLVSEIQEEPPVEWLIEDLWIKRGCGIIGGQPKCCKSWLGLDMALSIASGTPCLHRFPIHTKGSVVVFLAEDRVTGVRFRLSQMASARGVSLDNLPIYVLTPPLLLLDQKQVAVAFEALISQVQPVFVLLDPLVRLHHLDENNSRDIAGFLSFIRSLERKYGTAIALTHHAGKRGGKRPGQGLRGSSDLHAFGDSNLYLSRKGEIITLQAEHRSASTPPHVSLRLLETPHIHLSVHSTQKQNDSVQDEPSNPLWKVLSSLSSSTPIPQKELRRQLKVQNQSLSNNLKTLIQEELVVRTPQGLMRTKKEIPF